MQVDPTGHQTGPEQTLRGQKLVGEAQKQVRGTKDPTGQRPAHAQFHGGLKRHGQLTMGAVKL